MTIKEIEKQKKYFDMFTKTYLFQGIGINCNALPNEHYEHLTFDQMWKYFSKKEKTIWSGKNRDEGMELHGHVCQLIEPLMFDNQIDLDIKELFKD